MAAQNLLSKTQQLLSDSPEPRAQLANAAGIGYEWLKKFEADEIPNPGVILVQKLHDYLAEKASA